MATQYTSSIYLSRSDLWSFNISTSDKNEFSSTVYGNGLAVVMMS